MKYLAIIKDKTVTITDVLGMFLFKSHSDLLNYCLCTIPIQYAKQKMRLDRSVI